MTGGERYRRMFEHNAAVTLVIDAGDGRIIDANPAAERFYGYSRAELCAMHIQQINLAPPETIRERLALTAVSGEVFFRFEHRLKSGEVRPVNVHSGPFDDGGRRYLLSTIADATKAVEVERARSEAELRYRVLFERALEGIFFLDEQGRVLEVNPAGARMLGFAQKELVGATLSELAPRSADAGEPARAERSLRRKDGSLLEVEIESRLMDGGGAFTLIRDVTERRRREAAQRLESIGRLAGGIAHDFNNLLTAIGGFTHLALHSLPPDHRAALELHQVQDAVERASALTSRMLTLSRHRVHDVRSLSLGTVAEEMQEILRRLIKEDIELTVETQPTALLVEADRSHLEQVLLNLVTNARDAMPEGGRLALRTAPVRFAAPPPERAGEELTDWMLLAVEDTGSGMSEEVRSHLFEPFFTTKPPGMGTGLGLATTNGIVQQLRGFIRVHTEQGLGSRFEVYLPASAAAGAQPPAPPQPATARGGGETVLVVEDDDRLRGVTCRLLESSGLRVLSANGGAQALEHARGEPGPIHVLFTDLVMPGMNGFEVARAVRAVRPGIRVVYTSGYSDQAEAIGPGERFVRKPYSVEELTAIIRTSLERER